MSCSPVPWFLSSFPLLFISFPTFVAQFQQPTDEELQMTADPKAPGAAAVYLFIRQTTDDELHFKTYYARIKVLEEKGKELATVEIPYERGNFKVTDIKGRTIHPDGTVIPLSGKPEACWLLESLSKIARPSRSTKRSSTCPELKSAASSSTPTRSTTMTNGLLARTG